MGKVSPPKTIALDSKNQSAFTKAVRKVGKSMKKKKLEEEDKASRGIILVSHLPYGFFEDALKGFFSQFGKIRRIRVARSPKTGGSKGFAFIEFEFLEVAQIAAESMNNYLMYERLIKCKVIEPDVNAKKIFAAKYIRKNSFPTLFRRRKLIKALEEPMDTEDIEKQSGIRAKAIARNNKKLAALGIDYKYEDEDEARTPKIEVPIEEEVRKSSKRIKVETPEKFSPKPRSTGRKSEMGTAALPNSPSPIAGKVKAKTPLKFSPKFLRSAARKSEMGTAALPNSPSPIAGKAKTPQKFSPKLRSTGRKSEMATATLPNSPSIAGKVKAKTPQKFSPKLRSTGRKSEMATATLPNSPSIAGKVKAKTPQKFSPKLRSTGRKSEMATATLPNSPSIAGKVKVKTPQKFSPKFLRSRASQGPKV